MNCNHDISQGPHNPGNPQSALSADYKLATHKDKLFSYEAVKIGGVAEIMGTPPTWWKDLSMIWSQKQVTWMLLLWSKIITKNYSE